MREIESCLLYIFSTQKIQNAVYINVHKNESYKSQANLCECDKRSKHCLEFIEDACLAFFSIFTKCSQQQALVDFHSLKRKQDAVRHFVKGQRPVALQVKKICQCTFFQAMAQLF